MAFRQSGTGGDLDGPTMINMSSNHPGGANALFADGSVRFLVDSTPLEVLGRMATRDDGQPNGDVF